MNKLEGLEPKRVFYYFEQIANIPRCSYDEQNISNYIKSVGEKLNLETIQDEALNVIIRKPATPGYENAQGIIIQGHMDMVCEKEEDSHHDFKKDPIALEIEGDYIQADKTTLGADNGIAIAMGLALLEEDTIEHPDIELLVTTSEEVEMDGALGLSEDILRGTRLLNLDSEEEGVLIAGSAGGELIQIKIPANYQKISGYMEVSVEVKGLQGGHSGVEIHKARGNSNKILNSIVKEIKELWDVELISFEGGTKDNAIPRQSRAKIAVKAKELPEFREKVQKIKKEILHQYSSEESGMEIIFTEGNSALKVLSRDTWNDLVLLLDTLPTGVFTKLPQNNDIVESSSNLAIVKMEEEKIIIQISLRSSSEEVLHKLRQKVIDQVSKTQSEYQISGSYPEWQYNPKSQLRDTALALYKEMFGKEMESTVIHAGLECGVLAKKYSHLDIISFGPNMYDVHTPKERLSISSTERVYEYLVELLKKLK
ncbi:aminoacyl-histidine dipeptidase [Irregularibacter muris]|uniref:Cytosol non-specific dipeptidase n=1 Tax=Irregularibacter muris TaxID=1796619 RepID=A0AAE3HE48_9FIRM|nr:aminoacyl-histidine dipeptidase [Irregularibacter muris]MCR1897418.1 aminoacyl-histidine dipeptidase [Irregularibacter muris]